MCVQENDAFSSKFENGVVLTTVSTEHPGQSLKKKQKESQYRQGGILTVFKAWIEYYMLDVQCTILNITTHA